MTVAFAIPPRHDLSSAATQSDPNPHLVLLVAYKRPQFIQLQHVIALSGEQGRFEIAYAGASLLLDQLFGVFLSIWATVTRETFRARAMPR